MTIVAKKKKREKKRYKGKGVKKETLYREA